MGRLRRLVERFARWGAYIAAFLILAMSIWITYDVLARNLFGVASPWAFDLSEYSLVWMTFLAAPWILLRDGHVRIEIQDATGRPLTNFSAADCDRLEGDEIAKTVIWKTDGNGPFAAQPVRVRFEVKDADLFSFRFF